MSATVLRADARCLPLADKSVDLIVTSPPYFGLRSYTDGGEHYDGQVGSEATPAEFIDALIDCTREWVRVLKPSGSLWVNLGDKYTNRAGGKGWGGSKPFGGNTERAEETIKRRVTATRPDTSRSIGMPEKTLMGLPWRYALRCVDDLGLILRAEVIWSKPNGLPESVTDRVRRSHEQWFHLTREPRYFSAVDAIREEHTMRPQRRPAGRAEDLTPRQGQPRQAWSTSARSDVGVDGHPLGKLPGSVWTVPTEPLTVPASLGVDHFAAFPMEWPRRIIQGWSPSGVCVACGQGRRPVAHQTDAAYAAERARVRESRARTEREVSLGATFGSAGGRTNVGGMSNISNGVVRPSYAITGESCGCPDTTAPTRPGVVLDPFGGTGTTALVADALGRHGISVDLSHDYCRLARWRTTDPAQRAKALQVEKPPVEVAGQDDLLALL